MADTSIELNSGSGGATLAVDSDGSNVWQYVKLAFGASGTQTHVTTSAPLPVDLRTDNLGGNLDINVAASGLDLMLGTDFSGVFGTASVVDGSNHLQCDIAASSVTVSVQEASALDCSGATVTVDLGANNDVTVDGSSIVKAEDSAHQSGDDGVMALAVRNDTLAALAGTDGDYAPLQVNASGALFIQEGSALDVSAATVNIQEASALDVSAATVTVDATSSGDIPITLDSEAVVLGAGSAAIGKLAANSGVDIGDVDVTSISAGSNLIGDVGISGARTSGGTTPYRNIDVDESEDAVKTSGGQLYWVHAMNMTAAVLYLHFYNATTATVSVGSTTPTLTFPLATQGETTDGAGFVLSVPNGIEFDTAITIACTTTVGGSSGPAANGCIVNAGYA